MKYRTDNITRNLSDIRYEFVVMYYFLALSFFKHFCFDSQIRDLPGQDVGTLPPGLKFRANAF